MAIGNKFFKILKTKQCTAVCVLGGSGKYTVQCWNLNNVPTKTVIPVSVDLVWTCVGHVRVRFRGRVVNMCIQSLCNSGF